MGKKFSIVCLDRDGTILPDDGDIYLGKTDDWEERVKFLPLVVEGIRELDRNGIFSVMTTNQSGVALSGPEFDKLTEERMHETCRYTLNKLKERGAIVKGYFACPFVDFAYVEKAMAKGRSVNSAYVRDGCRDLKPNIGMVEKAAGLFGQEINDCNIYVIGDRIADIRMALNADGVGILVPGIRKEDVAKAEEAACGNPGRVYIASDFLDACNYVVRRTAGV